MQTGDDDDYDHDGQTGQIGQGSGLSASMQAQRIQRIRGNYEGETRVLPSGQDWPRNHSEDSTLEQERPWPHGAGSG